MDIFKNLKEKVFEANIRLKTEGLIVLTWGNVSAIDREHEVIAIKPSGIPYHLLKPEQIVIVDLKTSAPIVENGLAPSSDTPTHLELYRNFP